MATLNNILGDEGTLDRVKHTAIGQYIQSRLFLGLPVEVTKYTTLNEKFNINVKTRTETGDVFKAIYFCIGNGGVTINRTAGQPVIPDFIDHDPTDCALYHHMPFVLRPVNNDLTDEQRQRYRLRRKETYNGQDYYAYYARLMEYENTTRILTERVQKGATEVMPYAYTESNLSPREPELTVGRKVTASNVKIKVSTGAKIVFTEDDVREYANAVKIITGNSRYSVITELAIVAGVDDATYVSPDDGKRLNELKLATVICFADTYQLLTRNNNGFEEVIELGEKTPLPTTSAILPTVGVDPDAGRGVGG